MSRRPVKRWAGEPVEALRERWGREHVVAYGKIDSTNAAARDLAEEGAPAGTIVVCREQTAGRGRGDRRWHSPPDAGLYLSILFRPDAPVLPPLVSILAGLGVARELDRAFAGLAPRVKWPNDLIVAGRKLGGILAEASGPPTGPRHLVVGAGVNVRSMKETLPRSLRGRTTWIEAHVDEPPSLPEVADAVIRGLERWLHEPPSALDETALELLDRYDGLRNRRVVVRTPDDEEGIPGVAVGVAPDGALLFRPDRGALRRIAVATVEWEPEEAAG